MSDLAQVYAKVIKYNSSKLREPDFERLIDEDPTNPSNHLIYADWLQDHGDDTEAAFRRSLGKWFEQHTFYPSTKEAPKRFSGMLIGHKKQTSNIVYNKDGSWHVHGPYFGKDYDAVLPEGVDLPDYIHYEPGRVGHTVIHDLSGSLNIPSNTTIENYVNLKGEGAPGYLALWYPHPAVMSWPSYRNMEENFRRAFKSKYKNE